MSFLNSELILNEKGKVYHLDLGPEDIAKNVLLVGDPRRVGLAAKCFDSIRFETMNREFFTCTGTYRNTEFTVISTGIGTDNIDIVLTELDAAVNIDLGSRTANKIKRSLNLIRVGTCGTVQSDILPGTLIVSDYAIGTDGLAWYYADADAYLSPELTERFEDFIAWPENLSKPYAVACDSQLKALFNEELKFGITVTANGFYGPQGRSLRANSALSNYDRALAAVEWHDLRILNLEMETAGIYFLSKVLGHRAISVSLVLANRVAGTFLTEYKPAMEQSLRSTMDRFVAH